MLITVKEGLLWQDNSVISVVLADRIAQANDCIYAERFVKKYDGKILEIDDSTLKIIKENNNGSAATD